jgi:SPP1 family predicted phage head-tail adaptor
MMAGKLDRRIVIKTPTVTQDSHGGKVTTWTTLATVYASVTHLKGREHLVGGQFTPEAEVKFRLRYRSDFDESAQITHDGVAYDILHIAEIGRRRGLEVLAKKP